MLITTLTQKSMVLAMVMVTFIACNRPDCKSKNPIFNNNSYLSEIYKEELAIEIKKAGMENLSYWLSEYKEIQGKEYMVVSVQGPQICAKVPIRVINWDAKISDFHSKKGVTYSGARLDGLQFDIRHKSNGIEFHYVSVQHIID